MGKVHLLSFLPFLSPTRGYFRSVHVGDHACMGKTRDNLWAFPRRAFFLLAGPVSGGPHPTVPNSTPVDGSCTFQKKKKKYFPTRAQARVWRRPPSLCVRVRVRVRTYIAAASRYRHYCSIADPWLDGPRRRLRRGAAFLPFRMPPSGSKRYLRSID